MCSLSLVVPSAAPVRSTIHRESQIPLGKEKTAGFCLTEGEVPVAQLGAGYFYSFLIAFSFAVGIAEHAAILIKGCQMVVNEEEFVSERLNFELFV